MKNFIVILFLTSYLLSTTQLSELLKINVLIEHYVEHTNKEKNLSIWSFLKMHYAHGNVKDADYAKDMKLPFKALDSYHHIPITFCTPIQNIQFTKVFLNKLYKKPFYNYKFLFSSTFHSTIWQPPKID